VEKNHPRNTPHSRHWRIKMLSKQLQKDSAEQVTIVVKNVDAATITTGLGVALAVDTSCDGMNAIKQAATTYSVGFIGISQKDIPVNGYGTVVCWGVADSILLSNAGTSITVTKGDVLWPSAVAGAFYSSARGASVVNAGMSTLTASGLLGASKTYVIATSSNTVSAAAYVSGLVRAL
jgi:hypothetical protein